MMWLVVPSVSPTDIPVIVPPPDNPWMDGFGTATWLYLFMTTIAIVAFQLGSTGWRPWKRRIPRAFDDISRRDLPPETYPGMVGRIK